MMSPSASIMHMKYAWPRGFSRAVLATTFAVLPGLIGTSEACAQSVELGGTAFLDYFYTWSSPEPGNDGLHGFTARRLYLTADFDLSDDFYGRARLEADDEKVGESGLEPFVKDLWLTWSYAGEHEATLGITPPPAVQVSEDEYWGYRSLEQGILKFQDVVPSRDFGIRFDGPIGSRELVRYSVMLANNNARRPESDPYKRIYGQLRFYPLDQLTFTLGGDYAGYDDVRDRGTQLNAFMGYTVGDVRLGVEGYRQVITFNTPDEEFVGSGLSLFGRAKINSRWEIILRADRARNRENDSASNEELYIVAMSYSPIEQVRIIPNLWFHDDETAGGDETLGRITVEVDF